MNYENISREELLNEDKSGIHIVKDKPIKGRFYVECECTNSRNELEEAWWSVAEIEIPVNSIVTCNKTKKRSNQYALRPNKSEFKRVISSDIVIVDTHIGALRSHSNLYNVVRSSEETNKNNCYCYFHYDNPKDASNKIRYNAGEKTTLPKDVCKSKFIYDIKEM